MKVFVTGSSGWIGSAVVDELIANGHGVVGLVRSDTGAQRVAAAGAEVLRGDLDDLDSLRRGADGADAVVHLANKHDWSNPAESNRAERAAVETFIEALAGSDRPFVLAGGLAGLSAEFGRPGREGDRRSGGGPQAMRGGTEQLAFDSVSNGLHAISARFAPTVHGLGGDHGFIASYAQQARRRGTASYVGDGANAWSAVHRTDAARLVRLGIERAPAGTALHAAGEEAIPFRSIAAAIGAFLDLPVSALDPADVDQLGPLGRFFAMDLAASSAETRERFGWEPTGPTLLEDIAAGGYPGT